MGDTLSAEREHHTAEVQRLEADLAAAADSGVDVAALQAELDAAKEESARLAAAAAAAADEASATIDRVAELEVHCCA